MGTPVDYEAKLEEIRAMVVRNENAIEELDAKFDTISSNLQNIVPNGDFIGHSIYHAGLIEEQRRRRKLWDAIIEKTLSGLVWAAIVGIAIAVWHTILQIIRKG